MLHLLFMFATCRLEIFLDVCGFGFVIPWYTCLCSPLISCVCCASESLFHSCCTQGFKCLLHDDTVQLGMLLPKCQRCEQAVHPERYGRGTHCCGRCADTKLFEEVTHGQHCMHQRWEEGLSWDPGMKRFFIAAEISDHNVPTRGTTVTQRTRLMCHACVEHHDNYGPCRCLCRACPDVDDVPSHDVRTDGEWSDPGPPLNVNLLTAEGQVVVEALAQLREPDNTRGLVWIPDYWARFAGLDITLRELLHSHEDTFRVDQDWWIMSSSYESPYVEHVSIVERCM